MELVSEAVGAIAEQIAVLSKAAEELSHRELIGLLVELTTVLRSVPALEHKVLARLIEETQPHRLGEGSWKGVLATALRVSGAEAGRRLRRAEMLGPRRAMTGQPLAPRWEATAAAQALGLLDEEHITVIAKFHKKLPAWVDADTRAHADAQLARKGSGMGPEELDEAAGRLLMMIDQDGPEPPDTDLARKRWLKIGKQQRDGFSTISGYLDAETRAYLEATLAKEAAPGANMPDQDKEPGEDGAPETACRDTRTEGQRNHDGLKALVRRNLESGALGSQNGLPVTVIVSTTLQELEKRAGVAVTGGGSLLPMPDLIRMAAQAHHYLYVFDEHTGQSLYLGRARRLANAAQRIVLHARDRSCTRPGCTVPGYWCQVHHAVADWKNDGQTDIDDLTLACGPHNRMIETTGWTTSKNAKNQTEWIPPPELDTGQHRTQLINGYHHPERHLLPEDDQGP
ncbi:HNH endonuclease [Mycobacterium sp. SMC-8]|uniref:HNH endonuclease signature motif containing protein n=1 Tax=Mycobacterium sp. SMC-8 TaxID=2857060 RepID=UPI0021B42A36|nr:HNH endonuclease signature motif containing protein [Mycobacterium sp. SMC-8]UXA10934.1 HNH endonuclease [Mycobacterium sp. SMC-8]